MTSRRPSADDPDDDSCGEVVDSDPDCDDALEAVYWFETSVSFSREISPRANASPAALTSSSPICPFPSESHCSTGDLELESNDDPLSDAPDDPDEPVDPEDSFGEAVDSDPAEDDDEPEERLIYPSTPVDSIPIGIEIPAPPPPPPVAEKPT